MANWGRNYGSNRNQNSYQNYQHGRLYEHYANYGAQQQNYSTNSVHQSFGQNSLSFSPNGVGPAILPSTQNLFPYTVQRYQPSVYNNVEISSEILARAANSQLTPTAGEFIPSSVYQQSSNTPADPQQHNQTSRPSNYSNGNTNSNKNNRTSRSNGFAGESSSSSNGTKDASHFQKKPTNKGKNYNGDNRNRQVNIEQSKAEGRKKLLAEAAGFSAQQKDASGPSRATTSNSNEPSKWRPRGTGDNKTYYNGDSKVFSRSSKVQDRHQPRSSPSGRVGPSPRRERNSSGTKGVDEAVSQRERLTEQLNRGVLECLVCCEMVRQQDHTWSCNNCYHVLHLRCIIKWANTSKADNGWRCPACQNVTVAMPKEYLCFCGKLVNPDWNRNDTAHSCGEVCNRPKVLASQFYSCVHRCTVLCHPGPCPPCMALVTRKCGCGASSQSVQCGQTQPLVCGSVCGKALSCGRHNCTQQCHVGECEPCKVIIKQVCYCGKEQREVLCDGSQAEGEQFVCEALCGQQLSCGHHTCSQKCHAGPCDTCVRDPSLVLTCFCGKTPLGEGQQRTSCLDEIPTCGQVCEKPLTCGQPSSPHSCKAQCHEGQCPPCDQTTLVRCRCGYMDRELPCTELTTKADDARCQKKCTKKRTCGKHKCNQLCCIDVDHVCPLLCNHMLSCGQHRCEQLCHRGHCQPCLQSSFTELYCECGTSVLMPPISCGTRPPLCSQPCSRQHECDHEVLHTCHSYADCPPCGVLTSKYCYGKHELRKAVPCHMKEFSCGLPCGRALPCGRHKCIQPCHGGDCVTSCRQPCTKPRDLCGHSCNQPCHDGECPDMPCKQNVVVTCECGHRSMSRPCYENNSEYQRIATSLLASKMADVQLGRSVNLSDMQGSRKVTMKTLECSEECRVVERNRRLAIGLQIRNPDLSAKLTPRYSDFMRGWAKKDPRFCQQIHDKLTDLVKLAKESKQKSRSYSFETMNREKRQFVHEYCTHFGCESVAYDAEPKRNVVATAQRDKAWLPSYSLMEVLQREMGLRKVPLPNLNSSSQKTTTQSNVLPVRVALNQPAKSTVSDAPQIDYFDYNG